MAVRCVCVCVIGPGNGHQKRNTTNEKRRIIPVSLWLGACLLHNRIDLSVGWSIRSDPIRSVRSGVLPPACGFVFPLGFLRTGIHRNSERTEKRYSRNHTRLGRGAERHNNSNKYVNKNSNSDTIRSVIGEEPRLCGAKKKERKKKKKKKNTPI
mmetsp:Transcript_24786/g.50734  ORF Transcript_24786/g.50734 Transcript_24786/m.50734 type:complete len:154 (-) Transcript_24786:14-475(-)